MNSSIYRFLTIRNPQLVDDKTGKEAFVRVKDSSFVDAIAEATTPQARLDTLATVIDEFSPFARHGDVAAAGGGMHEFKGWLAKNKNNLELESLQTATAELSLLDSETRERLWDNLF